MIESDPEMCNRELGEPSLDGQAVDQDVAAFLQRPPSWWHDLVGAYQSGVLDKLRLNPLASEVAYAIYGSSHRWREVLPAIQEAVEHTNGIGSDEAGR